MSKFLVVGVSLAYLFLLFGIAYLAERRSQGRHSLVNNPYIYALSLGVYCTAWTFYGSVGRAATGGLSFLPIYLGPTIIAPLWLLVLRKMVVISKHQRITSVADFISSRYGKSTALGMIATLIAVIGIIPYISIQLKAIVSSYQLLTGGSPMPELPFFLDPALYITIFLTLFTILFGTRHLDPNERHEGMVAAIAFESLFKLVAFLAVGLFVTFGLFRGFGDLFGQAAAQDRIVGIFQLSRNSFQGWEWFWLTILSMFAIMMLPRQFHLSVVENTHSGHIRKASWLFPVYLLLINFFVLPIAVGGLLLFPEEGAAPDTYVLSLPMESGRSLLALFVALGGFSAASSMVIVAVIALSIMVSNQLVLPALFKPRLFSMNQQSDLQAPLLGIRRVSMAIVLLLAYGYFRWIGREYTLVAIGLISFTAIAQFAPALFGGMYWKRATKAGAIAGLITGFVVWILMLLIPSLIEAELIEFVPAESKGIFSSRISMSGLVAMDSNVRIAQAAFWSLLLNSSAFFGVSIYTRQRALEISQADLFVDIYKYSRNKQVYEVMRREARVRDIRMLLNRFLGETRTGQIFYSYERRTGLTFKDDHTGRADLINLAETHLAGVIGASSAKVIMATITKEDPISLEEMFKILEQTQEIIEYSKAIERKSKELEETSRKLREANEQLQELDKLKAEFITTVTHELRTPITSIKALSKILLDNEKLEHQQKKEFLSIIVGESERIARLISQVLDIEKLQVEHEEPHVPLDVKALVRRAYAGLQQLMRDRRITHSLEVADTPLQVLGNHDRLTQVVVNLIANAIKFCDPEDGVIKIALRDAGQQVVLSVRDNGRGIAPEKQDMIFEKFTQVSDQEQGKPTGSGLGLFITKSIIEQHKGSIHIQSTPGAGATFVVTLPKFLVPVDAFSWQE